MKKYEIIRKMFDRVMEYGVAYDKPDAISSDSTIDALKNRVYIKKVELTKNPVGAINVTITGLEPDYSDATDSSVRIEFRPDLAPGRTILWANEVGTFMLSEILNYM